MARRTSAGSTCGASPAPARPAATSACAVTNTPPRRARLRLRASHATPAPTLTCLRLHAEDPQHLWHEVLHPRADLFLVEAGDGVRRGHELEPGEAVPPRHGLGRDGERVSANADSGHPGPLQHDPVGQTGRAAGASIADAGHREVAVVQDLLD